MKKIITVLISIVLIFGLSSCGDNKQKYTPVPKFDIKTCGDDCLYEEGTQAIRWMDGAFKDSSDLGYPTPGDFEYTHLGGSGETFFRTDLNTMYTIGGKYRENYLDVYEGFARPISFMSILWDDCANKDTCESSFLYEDVIKNLSYGFTEKSGYLNFDIYNKDDILIRTNRMSYEVVNEDLQYQYYYMDYEHDQPTYIEYKDGIFTKYFTWHSDMREYIYIDTNTEEYIAQYFNEDETKFYYYSPENGIGYQYNWVYLDAEYSVFLVKDSNDMFSVNYDEERYYIDINFNNMEGWDTIEDYLQPSIAPNDERHIWGQYKLYLDDTRVYEDYQFMGYFMNEFYDVVTGTMDLALEEISDYSLPKEFMYDVDQQSITKSFLSFIELEDKTDVLPYKQEDILSFFEELKTLFK